MVSLMGKWQGVWFEALLTCVELIDTSHPLQVGLWEVIECDKVVVARNAMDGTDTKFIETPEEILCHINRLFKAPNSEV